MGIDFEVRVPDVDEVEDGPPREVAFVNALRKAEAVAREAPDAAVLGVDTVVALDGRIHGKPADEQQARATLRALAGRRHEVLSGLCLLGPVEPTRLVVVTAVEFRTLDEDLVEWYLSSGEWRERAGGYAIQGHGAALVKRIDGDYLNVVGLPLAALLDLHPELLRASGG